MFHGTGASGEMGVRMLWQWPDMMLQMVNLVRLYVGLKNKKGMITLLGLYCRPPSSQCELEQICQEII